MSRMPDEQTNEAEAHQTSEANPHERPQRNVTGGLLENDQRRRRIRIHRDDDRPLHEILRALPRQETGF